MKPKPIKSTNKPCIKCGGHVCVSGRAGRGNNVRICSNEDCQYEEKDR